jgi:hypothetical protein
MRLLSDKMQDKKSFVHSLARAVSRSNVILISGPLFGENGTIQTVAEAINTTTQNVNNKEFGIDSEQEISILKDSTPLVTSDGYFGGCIIESGPQTMILLTENKDIRKTIMKTLIHPYIEELYAAQIKFSESSQEQTFEDDNIIISDDSCDEITSKEVQDEVIIQEDETNESDTESSDSSPEDLASDDYQPEQEEVVDLFVEPTKLDRQTVERYTQEYTIKEDYYNYDQEDFYAVDTPKRKIPFSLPVLIISIVLLLVIAVLFFCIFIVPAQQNISPVANLQEIFTTMFG